MGGILARIVELLEPARPADYSYEERIRAAIYRGEGNIAAIIEQVAEDARRADQARGAWIVDVGVWGPGIYRREALAAFQQMLGRSLVLQVGDTGYCHVALVAAA